MRSYAEIAKEADEVRTKLWELGKEAKAALAPTEEEWQTAGESTADQMRDLAWEGADEGTAEGIWDLLGDVVCQREMDAEDDASEPTKA